MQHCPFCSSVKVTIKYDDLKSAGATLAFKILFCEECGGVFKIQLELNLNEVFYEGGEWIKLMAKQERQRYRFRKKRFESIYPFLKKGRLLEVGPGDGWFLRIAKDFGFEVFGVETSKTNCEYIKKRYNILVSNNSLEDENYPDEFFDSIILSHVIEHIPNPKSFFKEINRVLKPGGTVYIATPNQKSYTSKAFKKYWPAYYALDHVTFYNFENITNLLKNNNFDLRRTRIYTTESEGGAYFIGAIMRTVELFLTRTRDDDQRWNQNSENVRNAIWGKKYSTSFIECSRIVESLFMKVLSPLAYVLKISNFANKGSELVVISRK